MEPSACRLCYHVATVAGWPTVYLAAEWPRHDPPERVEVDGSVWVRERVVNPVIEDAYDGEYDLTCPDCGWSAYYSLPAPPSFCQCCGARFLP